jgi:hypothetical protein
MEYDDVFPDYVTKTVIETTVTSKQVKTKMYIFFKNYIIN